MKTAAYVVTMALSVLCALLCAALILTAASNERMQIQLQNRQQALNSGILGQQGQALAGSILQEMGAVAIRNSAMRRVLEQHGYQVQAGNAPGSSTNIVQDSLQSTPVPSGGQVDAPATTKP